MSSDSGLEDVENLAEIQEEIDILNVMLKLMDTEAFIAYQKFNKPVLSLWGQYYPAALSKKPWRFHFRRRMACFTSFDRLKERVEHLMEDHRSGVECRLSGHR